MSKAPQVSPWSTPEEVAAAGSNALEVVPEPEIRARPALDEDLGTPKSGMRQLLKVCATLGLTTKASYARGPYVGANGTALRISDSVVIRVYEPGGRQVAAATWVDQAFEHAYLRPPGERPVKVGANDLKSNLKERYA